MRCDRPAVLASRLFESEHTVEAQLNDDRGGVLVRTVDPDGFYRRMNEIVLSDDVKIETVTVADSDVRAVYQYLIGSEGEAR